MDTSFSTWRRSDQHPIDVLDELLVAEVVSQVRDRPPDVAGNKAEYLRCLRCESFDAKLVIDKDAGYFGGVKEVVHIVVGLCEFFDLILEFRIDGGKLFIDRLKFLAAGLKLLVGALQLLVVRLQFLVGRCEFLIRRLQLDGSGCQPLFGYRKLAFQFLCPHVRRLCSRLCFPCRLCNGISANITSSRDSRCMPYPAFDQRHRQRYPPDSAVIPHLDAFNNLLSLLQPCLLDRIAERRL